MMNFITQLENTGINRRGGARIRGTKDYTSNGHKITEPRDFLIVYITVWLVWFRFFVLFCLVGGFGPIPGSAQGIMWRQRLYQGLCMQNRPSSLLLPLSLWSYDFNWQLFSSWSLHVINTESGMLLSGEESFTNRCWGQGDNNCRADTYLACCRPGFDPQHPTWFPESCQE